MSITLSHRSLTGIIIIALLASGGGVYSGYLYAKMQSRIEYQNTINSMQNQINNLNATNTRLENRLSDAQNDISEFQIQIENYQSENIILLDDIIDLENNVTDLTEKIAEIQKLYAPLDGTVVRIGKIFSTTTSYESGVTWVEEVIEPGLNEYASLLGYDVTFDVICGNAEGQAAIYLENVQMMKSIGIELINGGPWSSMAQAILMKTTSFSLVPPQPLQF